MSGLVSTQCVDFVKSFEGFSATVYKDAVGVPTLGYGMTGSAIAGLTSVTESQASLMLENLLNTKYAQPIKNDLDAKGVKLTQNQFDALISMSYNIGVGGLLGSTLYRDICNGIRDVTRITTDFEMWCKAGGQTLVGLLRRRQAEAKMFFGNGNTIEGVEKQVENIVIYNFGPDMHSAELLADYLNCPTISNSRKFDFSSVKNIYAVGGNASQYTTKVTKLLTGSTRYDTAQAVLSFIASSGK